MPHTALPTTHTVNTAKAHKVPDTSGSGTVCRPWVSAAASPSINSAEGKVKPNHAAKRPG